MFSVLADRLEETGEERRAHDLVLDRFGVGENDGESAGVFAVQESKVFVMGALFRGSREGKKERSVGAFCFSGG